MNPTNNNNTLSFMTRSIVNDYIHYKLNQKGFEWQNCPPLQPVTEIHIHMRSIGDEFEERYTEVFNEMCNSLHITPNSVYSTFQAVTNELFSEGIRWGRIVALFAFGGSLAIQCVNKEMPDLVSRISDWVTTYIENNLTNWIRDHDGWEGFVEFYRGRNDRRKESPWPSMKKFLCGIAAGAVGVITVGALLSNR